MEENKNILDSIRNCKDFSSASAMANKIEDTRITSRQCFSIGKTVNRLVDSPDIKIALLSNFTIDMLSPYVSFFSAAKGIQSDIYIGEFNQYNQEVLSSDSGLRKFKPDVIFFSLSLRDLIPDIVYSFSSLNDNKKLEILNWIVEHFKQFVLNVDQHMQSTILISNFSPPHELHYGIADNNMEIGEMRFYYELNTKLLDLALENTNVHIFDFVNLTNFFGLKNIFDSKMYYMAKILWSNEFCVLVAKELIKYLVSIIGITKKCLVLDLDNTLWGGILGEDGIDGVKVGKGDPVSEIYYDFQQKIRSLKNRGVMLAICSKNNEHDVIDMFDARKSMPLKISDFSTYQINWDHKHLNIQRIAQNLNIGLDSMVFIDDNPVECDLVSQMIPEVKTILLPKNLEKIPFMFSELADFEKLALLEDDLLKTEKYHENNQRSQYKDSVSSLEEYLDSLETEISISRGKKENIERIQQLFLKTNQFNLTTIRHKFGDIKIFLKDNSYDLYVISAKDKFGELGIIGLYLLEFEKEECLINSFILSCRAMGRGIETAIMNHLKANVNESYVLIKAKYIPTKKNVPVADFYSEQGFTLLKKDNDGSKIYSLKANEKKLLECSWIQVKLNENGA